MGELGTREDVHDLIRGLTLLGTGGGGRPDVGLELLLPHVQGGRTLGWRSAESVDDDAWVCSVFGMGSIAPTTPLTVAARTALGYPSEWVVPRPMVRAVEELAAYTGRKIAAILPFELGAGNTANPIDAAHRLGLDLIDGDCAGRAIPELSQTTAALAGIPFTPGAIADPWGNVLIMKEAASAEVAERLGKMISIATKLPDMKAPCAHAGFLMRGRELKTIVVLYGLAKAALLHLTESLAVELAPHITVNAVVPSQIAGPRTDRMPAYRAAAIAATPLGRLVTPGEIARMVVLLCSPAFDFVTGRAIVMDGGRTIPVFPRLNLAAGMEP